MVRRARLLSITGALVIAALLMLGGAAARAETTDTTPPSVPDHLRYTPYEGIRPAGVLRWDVSTDDQSDVNHIHYRLYYEGERIPTFGSSPMWGIGTYVDFYDEIWTCLHELPSGSYAVTAVDRAGNESAPSQPIEIDLSR